jgi:hypothetical protein
MRNKNLGDNFLTASELLIITKQIRGRRREIIVETGLSKATVDNFFQATRISKEAYEAILKTVKRMMKESLESESREDLQELKTLLKEAM